MTDIHACRADLSLGSGWVGAWAVGGGANGTVQVWLKQDSAGAIIDRVAIKNIQPNGRNHPWRFRDLWWPPLEAFNEASFRNSKREFFIDEASIEGDDQQLTPTLAIEVLAPYKLRGRIGNEGSVALLNWRVNYGKEHMRLYQEYCPYGDLWKCLDYKPQSGQPRTYWVPEAFVWHTLETLGRVCVLFERGELDRDPISGSLDSEPWLKIVHRDWKLDNVFLGPPLADRYRGYPTPKVGDFGYATFVAHNEKRQPLDFMHCGTPGCRAPETALPLRKMKVFPTAKTDVFGVGLVANSLMELQDGDDALRWEIPILDKLEYKHPPEEQWHDEPEISRDVINSGNYSRELVDLVNWCTRFRPEERPTWSQVMDRIQLHHRGGQHGAALRDAHKSDPGFTDRWLPGNEKYAIFGQVKDHVTELRPGVGDPSLSFSDGDDNRVGGSPGAEFGESERQQDVGGDRGRKDGDIEQGTRAPLPQTGNAQRTTDDRAGRREVEDDGPLPQAPLPIQVPPTQQDPVPHVAPTSQPQAAPRVANDEEDGIPASPQQTAPAVGNRDRDDVRVEKRDMAEQARGENDEDQRAKRQKLNHDDGSEGAGAEDERVQEEEQADVAPEVLLAGDEGEHEEAAEDEEDADVGTKAKGKGRAKAKSKGKPKTNMKATVRRPKTKAATATATAIAPARPATVRTGAVAAVGARVRKPIERYQGGGAPDKKL